MHKETHWDGNSLKLPKAHITRLKKKEKQAQIFSFSVSLLISFGFWTSPKKEKKTSEDGTKCFVISGEFLQKHVMSRHVLVHRGSLLQACLGANTVVVFLAAFGGGYRKPWLEAWTVYFVLLFSWRPSHDKAVGMAANAGQEFQRSSADCQDDGRVTRAGNHT